MKAKFKKSITTRSTTTLFAISMLGILMTSTITMPYNSNVAIVHAATDSTAIMKKINGVKSGSYTYYYNSKNLVREDKEGKVQKLTDKITGDFYVTDNYIYYVTLDEGHLYSMKKDGSDKQRLAKSVRGILRIEGEHIYYRSSSLAIYRININGKGKEKILGITNSYNYIFSNGRMYYVSRVKDPKGNVSGYNISSVNMAGKNKKTYITIPVSDQGYDNFGFVTSKNYVYISSSTAIYKIDQVGKVHELYTSKAGESLEVLYASDNQAYFKVTARDSNTTLIQKIKANGSISTFVDCNDIGFSVDQGVKLEKSDGYFILYCYGDDSKGRAYILHKNGNLLREVPNKIKSFKHADISKVIIRDTNIYVSYIDPESGSTVYRTYGLNNE